MKIYIGADHRGFELKEKLKQWLLENGHEVEDVGAHEYSPHDDYPAFALAVAERISADTSSMGIIACGSGVGVSVAANKVRGVRASVAKNAEQIAAGRADDDMNVLVIAADYTNDDEAKNMVEAFLETSFSGEDRHVRRLSQVEEIENNN